MKEELKPCPFCGGSNIIVSETDDESMSGFDAVECADCGCEIMGSTAAGWNTRALTPKQQCADDMYEMLGVALVEIQSLIDESNASRLGKVTSQTLTEPDLIDGETCFRIQELLAKARGEQ